MTLNMVVTDTSDVTLSQRRDSPAHRWQSLYDAMGKLKKNKSIVLSIEEILEGVDGEKTAAHAISVVWSAMYHSGPLPVEGYQWQRQRCEGEKVAISMRPLREGEEVSVALDNPYLTGRKQAYRDSPQAQRSPRRKTTTRKKKATKKKTPARRKKVTVKKGANTAKKKTNRAKGAPRAKAKKKAPARKKKTTKNNEDW